jgi:hypothetical protein
MNRQFIFRHYWKLALIGLAVSVAFVLRFAPTDRFTLIGFVATAALGFCYFIQQQKLAETTLFKQLFTEFNHRYDKMNNRLTQIAESKELLDATERREIVDYFNLCAEEYLFFREGYIHPEAWSSWCAGMLFYFEHEPIKKVWSEEEQTSSYYGLSVSEIRKGAA